MTYVYLLRRIAMIKFYAMKVELNSVRSGDMYVVVLRYILYTIARARNLFENLN